MLKRILLWALILLLACAPVAACAVDDAEIIDGILAYFTQGQDIQTWIDTELTQNAGGGMDNLVLALLRMNRGYDFTQYANALDTKLSEGIKSVTTRQRAVLVLSVLGGAERIPEGFADETIGQMGVMSYVFGLHLLNAGFESELWTWENLIDKLYSLQLEDGGWAVSGKIGDPDVTAMCLQALSGSESKSEVFEQTTQRALIYLSSVQNNDGGYTSYGQPACESSAQVIDALISLGIDPLTDERFIKNGHTALDAMLTFRLSDGSFSHLQGGNANTMACVQTLSALISLQNPDVPVYAFESISQAAPAASALNLPLWKIIALSAIALTGLTGTIVSLCRKNARGKRLLLVWILCCIAVYGVCAINIQSAADYYSEPASEQPVAGQAYLSVRCDKVAGRATDGSSPENGEILARTAIDFYEGDSIFDLLTHAARKYEIQIEYQGSADTAYINSINYLYEYAYGDLSGWIYTLNGEKLSVGSAGQAVQNGDEIVWHYTLTLGEDIQ